MAFNDSRIGKESPIGDAVAILPPIVPTNGGANGVKVLRQGFNVDPLIQRQADCISTMTYNEYWQVIDAGVSPDELVTFKYEEQGVATLEAAIYFTRLEYKTPPFTERHQLIHVFCCQECTSKRY